MTPDTFPLPEGWSGPEVISDEVVVDGIRLRRAGVCSTGPSGEELTGAAVEVDDYPIDRAYFELLERMSTVEALREAPESYEILTGTGDRAGARRASEVFPESSDPARWRYARSSGVALHADWRRASERALWELAERDRVLRAWYGETRAARVDLELERTPLGGSRSYEWLAYSFPSAPGAMPADVDVVGVFGLPSRPLAPFVYGYGARPDRADALDAAVREALQLLAFLWGEPVLDRPPEPAPTPLFHLERYQWIGSRAALLRWLEVGHGVWALPAAARDVEAVDPVAFVDLTPAWLPERLRVAKAVCQQAAPLAFGESPFVAHLPYDLRIHPIG